MWFDNSMHKARWMGADAQPHLLRDFWEWVLWIISVPYLEAWLPLMFHLPLIYLNLMPEIGGTWDACMHTGFSILHVKVWWVCRWGKYTRVLGCQILPLTALTSPWIANLMKAISGSWRSHPILSQQNRAKPSPSPIVETARWKPLLWPLTPASLMSLRWASGTAGLIQFLRFWSHFRS